MSSGFTYQEYVTDEKFLADYNAYQAKYAKQMRESDKVLLGLVREAMARSQTSNRSLRLLDVGCSTGNLLLHMKRLLPELQLVGGDLAESSLDECRANPDLAGIEFKVTNLLALPTDDLYDIITVNAVLYMMEEPEFEKALASLREALAPGGTLLVFDFFHPFEQELTMIEKSSSHPNGLRLSFRPMGKVTGQLERAGFSDVAYNPFTLPIDLPCDPDSTELVTYTVPAADGRRLPFRGTLFQPWCHLVARRGA